MQARKRKQRSPGQYTSTQTSFVDAHNPPDCKNFSYASATSNDRNPKLRKQAREIDFNLIGWTLTICRTQACVNLNGNQHHLLARKHGEEIGLSAYWLPA